MYVFLVWSYKEKVVICKTNVRCENRYKLGPSHGIPWALTMQLVIDICSVALLHSGLQNLNFLLCFSNHLLLAVLIDLAEWCPVHGFNFIT